MKFVRSLADEIIFGTVSGVEDLIRAGADVNEIDVYGFTPLIESAIMNSAPIAALLIRHGAKINEADLTGRTALHWSVDNSNLELTELLLKNKADPNSYTKGGQPILVKPLLRDQPELKKLLYQFGADLRFAQDFISTKLLGHRYELTGQVDIVNTKGEFIELDFEGFYLEFTLGIIQNSLRRYKNNFGARHLRYYFRYIEEIISALNVASRLIKYQQYTYKVNEHEQEINALLDFPIAIIPVAHRGHAITFIKFGNLFAKCDRGENSKSEGSVVIYNIHNMRGMTKGFIKELIYQKQSPEFIKTGYKQVLDLEPLIQLPVPPQITGNCSWANVEAVIPTILFLLLMTHRDANAHRTTDSYVEEALDFYQQWIEWDRDRSLDDCVKNFNTASRARKASKVAILAAILFQKFHYENPKDIERAEKIMPILFIPEYRYVLNAYVHIFTKKFKTTSGYNLLKFIEDYESLH